MKINIVGLDPSLQNFGVAHALLDTETMALLIGDLKLVHTEPEKKGKQVRKNSEDLERARLLYEGMTSATKGAAIAIAEVPVGSQSARAMASYGMCVGVLASCQIPLVQVTPSEVKLVATGYKNATKQEMIEWAMQKYPEAPWLRVKRGGVMVPTNANEHLADAVAAIEAGIKTDQFKGFLALMKVAESARAAA
ncbi:crossover junction endodeoxyribonuclease RuvC [Cupriavidus campinensis]|uniref:Crossover junction endodeoxyribonuclease RuvC n=1 Tax=Cupriavidus campinensis TaxID=151783 RepID=A0ABY3ESR0_9BURK|nr:crossover junction endodeoxyribonuclease RuvC [Cupriavidus campinensis]TSP14010.1 crossover junction endodeoxyribonuclease RuvC [Cupriavidus campinensis]